MHKPLKSNAVFSETERTRVNAACERLNDEFLKPRFLPSIKPTEFNYPVDILGKWHGAKYRFIRRYRSGLATPRSEPLFTSMLYLRLSDR